ncbi:hypothetical protein AVEN_196354-1 [Araneus ventricosus]|uniref:Uncharacterized protein n=1 Tax=Araneus ventricosus TaxID=182803 RepID=A0A4Y2AWP7_ARAVE|nr:hypothetical protein AVEN_196354-1 [Araneus ventricosus]
MRIVVIDYAYPSQEIVPAARWRPLHPRGKISVSCLECFGFDTGLYQTSSMYAGVVMVKSDFEGQIFFRTSGVANVSREEYGLRCHPYHLAMLQICEVYPEIAHLLLLNGT